jgi:hypothetical protein
MPAMRFAEFWPVYLAAHSHPANRRLHVAGTAAALLLLLAAALAGLPWLALAAVIVGYGAAWCGHFLIEGNRPATFGHPFLSLAADFRMLGLFVRGRLEDEAARLIPPHIPPSS